MLSSVRAPLASSACRAPAPLRLHSSRIATTSKRTSSVAASGSSGEGGSGSVQRWRGPRSGAPSLFSLLMNDLDMNMDPFSALAQQITAPSSPEKYIALDVFETDDHIEIHADMPGVSKENIKIESNKDILTLSVSAQTSKEGEEEQGGRKWYKSERSSSFMRRSVRLPEYADAAAATASYENGVLAVKVPKKEQKPAGTVISVE
eukprot:TRINITY_DN5761_c0_g1_i10.p1 TRINITY_DN5761_c0_g1~~TRINITY_DN5761_c0_g1_i10.p1  ORF type:complete len:232 (-),score=29.85 TRINITY_DN5761_c0_g1_i10:415-1029(-)